jgi:hypothetical protein
VVAGGAALCAAVALSSIAIFGWDTHVLWYRLCVEPFSGAPMPAFNVQSVQAFVARFSTGYGGLHDWEVYPLSDASQAAAAVITAALYLGALAVMLRPAAASAGGKSAHVAADSELLMVIALACMTSPLSWSHYYVWLLLGAAFLISRGEQLLTGRVWAAVAGAAMMLASLPIVDVGTGYRVIDQLYARLPVSYLLCGGLLALLLLARARNVPPMRAAAPRMA